MASVHLVVAPDDSAKIIDQRRTALIIGYTKLVVPYIWRAVFDS